MKILKVGSYLYRCRSKIVKSVVSSYGQIGQPFHENYSQLKLIILFKLKHLILFQSTFGHIINNLKLERLGYKTVTELNQSLNPLLPPT